MVVLQRFFRKFNRIIRALLVVIVLILEEGQNVGPWPSLRALGQNGTSEKSHHHMNKSINDKAKLFSFAIEV